MKHTITVLFGLFFLLSCTFTKKEPLKEYIIAYNVYVPDSIHDDNYDIFTMKMDGTYKKNITDHPDVAWTYLSHGDKIYFVSDRDTTTRTFFLYEMDHRGEQIKKISNFQLRDSWMGTRKHGQELIVVPHPKVDSLLYLINTEGEILKKINPGTPYFSDPSFSPDGEWIAFVGSNKKSKKEDGYQAEIYVVNTDGNGLKKLTNYPTTDTTAEWYAYKAGPPRWHPTENFISYQSKQQGKYSLYAVSPDGKQQWKLTDNSQNEGWHSWSPDGKWLAIEFFDEGQDQFHIGLMNWRTKEMQVLTDTSFKFQQAPVFLEVDGNKN
ncbi:TolB protein [Arenibacter nanhaiticus]|uniref:TolB protein n=1 Tax=Arenibacter nanhaiticus TaxID=558155 RepID=A0A1M6DPT7_9FLAO|nr:PD40 domain-containing protein [Arenibacter nanhaiticus]SHI75159.1 TolB protein [Arenibacter nanhaiticus]